jgi:hypothetical protein
MYLGGGLGNVAARQGIDVRHPSSIPATADWVAKYIANTHDMSPWHGFHGKRDWNPSWGNMGYSPMKQSGPPPKSEKQSRGGDVYLQVDGRTFAKIASEQLARLHEHTTHAPYAARGLFIGPEHQYAVG